MPILSIGENKGKTRKIKFRERILYLMYWAEEYKDLNGREQLSYRFAHHKYFIYHMHQLIMKDQLLKNTLMYLKWNDIDRASTDVAVIKKVFEENPDKVKDYLRTCQKDIAGTPAHAKAKQKEVFAMIQELNAPTIWFTISFPNTYCDGLRQMLGVETDKEVYINIMRSNPHLQDRYFEFKIAQVIKHWLHNTMGAKYYTIVSEEQRRDAMHVHGFAWLNEPGMGIMAYSRISLTGFIAQNKLQGRFKKQEGDSKGLLEAQVKKGREAEKIVVDYAEKIGIRADVAQTSENGFKPAWKQPNSKVPHPCKVRHAPLDDPEALERYYVDLVNATCIHRCSYKYCLNKKTNECKHNFPYEPLDEGRLVHEIRSTKYADQENQINFRTTHQVKRPKHC